MKHVVEFSPSSTGYLMRKFYPDEMCNLGNFLSTDYMVFKKFNFIKDWLNNPNQHFISGNLTYLEKRNGVVSIGDLFEEESDVNFNISVKNLVRLLNDWERIIGQKPKRIIITKRGDEITVEGRD